MDSERAETHLRLLAERELRRAQDPARQPGPSRTTPAAVITVSQVAHALVIAGALDNAIGGSIVQELALALESRQPESPPSPGPRSRRWWPAGMSSAARPAAVPPLLVATGLTMSIPDGTLHLLSYLQTSHRTRFLVVARTADPAGLDGLTASDEAGTRYRLTFTGGSSSHDWAGELVVSPDPPPGLRWLEIAGPGSPAQRIELIAGPGPDCSTTGVPPSPGEHLLQVTAADLLARLPDFPPEERRAQAAGSQLPSVNPNFGEIVRALESAGALSPDSRVPGQFAVLCEAVGIDDHGLTIPSNQDLPGPWAGVLTSDRRAKPPDGCAGIALTLPEIDGIVVSVTGLDTVDGISTLHLHASGMVSFRHRIGVHPLPLIWLRDSGGSWHATCYSGGGQTNGEGIMQLTVIPALSRPDWIEVVASGRSAEVRATVPLRWG
jgi:hypothetical protein